MSRGWAGGSTRAHRRARAIVLDRDGYACRLKLPGCTHGATQAHHLDGVDAGPDPARMIAACQHCNGSLGDPTTARDPDPRPATLW